MSGFMHEHPWMFFWLVVAALIILDNTATNVVRVWALRGVKEEKQ